MKKKIKHMPFHDNAGHLKYLIDTKKLQTTARSVIRYILEKKLNDKFDAIAFRGLSGALIAPIVALRLGKTLLAVRKDEDCHSFRQVEGDLGANSYVILDDFVSSGNTVRAINEEISKRKNDLEDCDTHDIGMLKFIGVICANRIVERCDDSQLFIKPNDNRLSASE